MNEIKTPLKSMMNGENHLSILVEEQEAKITSLRNILKRVREDLLRRSEEKDDDGTIIVDLGATLWDELCNEVEGL